MKIVVGGASSVGKSIVGYLSLGNNDIVVVDTDSAKLDEIAKEYDVQPVLGSISHPDIQESIGMKNMDMLIAGHARAENVILVTNNTREFERVENLRLENWAEEHQ